MTNIKQYKATFSVLVDAIDEEDAADIVSYDLSFLWGEYMLDKVEEIPPEVESIFDLYD